MANLAPDPNDALPQPIDPTRPATLHNRSTAKALDCKTTVIDRPEFSWPLRRATSAFVSAPHPFDFR